MHDQYRNLRELITSPTTTGSVVLCDADGPPDSTVTLATDSPTKSLSPSSSLTQLGDADEGGSLFCDLLDIGRILTDAADGDASDHRSSSDYIEMHTSVYPEACLRDCRCRCHGSGTAIRSPAWLQPVLGTLLVNYGCVPNLTSSWGAGAGEKCDEKRCTRARASRVELSYFFPTRVLKRALCFSVELGGSLGHGAALHLSVPRVFSSYDEAWQVVNFGDLAALRTLWSSRQGEYSPLDVNEHGMSLLSVSVFSTPILLCCGAYSYSLLA